MLMTNNGTANTAAVINIFFCCSISASRAARSASSIVSPDFAVTTS